MQGHQRAVCLRCGADKWGALTACRRCGHHPTDPTDRARHLVVSDDLDEATRREVARAVAAGQPLELEAAAVDAAREALERASAIPAGFVAVVAGGPLLAVVAGLVGLACCVGAR